MSRYSVCYSVILQGVDTTNTNNNNINKNNMILANILKENQNMILLTAENEPVPRSLDRQAIKISGLKVCWKGVQQQMSTLKIR